MTVLLISCSRGISAGDIGKREMSHALGSLLPLAGEGGAKRRMRGLSPRRETPHPPTMLRISGPLSRKGRGGTADAAWLATSRYFDAALAPMAWCGPLQRKGISMLIRRLAFA